MSNNLTSEQKEIVEYCRKLRDIAYSEKCGIEALSMICDFAESLCKRYPILTVKTCYLYHVMIGSTFNEPGLFDMPGQDSIVLFLERLIDHLDHDSLRVRKLVRR